MQMTEKKYKEIVEKLYLTKAEYEEMLVAQRDAAEAGDLRENTEYETARLAVERLSKEIAKMEIELSEAEIVPEDNSLRITIGSTIDVTRVDSQGQPVSATRRFRFDSSGNTVIMGVLGAKSSLGKAINNGTDGIYTIPDNGGIAYLVKKVMV